MGSVVLKSLSILLGVFFIFVGTMKLTSIISKDLHKDLRKEYVKYAKVFPLAEALNFKVPAKWYRRVFGSLEIVSGFAMAFIPIHSVKQGANIVLLFLMMMAVYSHYMVNDKFERIAPALVELIGISVFWYWKYSYNDTSVRPSTVGKRRHFDIANSKVNVYQVFFFMLTGRMVIDWQLRRKMESALETNGDIKQKKQD